MVSQTELHRWRKYRLQSRAMLRPASLFGILGTSVLLALLYIAEDPTAGWGYSLFMLVTVWFGFVGDWLNVRYLDRRIAEAEREHGPA